MERLSSLDAAFLRAETPSGHMHVGWVSELGRMPEDASLDADLLRDRVEARLHLAPRFRQRVVGAPLGEPLWADDPGFDIARHVRVAGDGAVLGRSELAAITDAFLSAPLDRGRPLWEILVVPRLEARRAALLGKVHHSMVDGVAAVELGMLLFDLAPDPAPPEPVDWEPEEVASGLRLAASTATDGAIEQFRSAGRLARLGLQPGRTLRVAESMRRAALSLAEDALAPAPPSYLNTEIDDHRSLATGSLKLERLRRLKEDAGVTLNDVVLALGAGALRRLAALREEEPAPLRVMVPVSVRGDGDAAINHDPHLPGASPGGSAPKLGNRITFAFVDLPVEEPDPARRLAGVHGQTRELKRSGRVAGSDLLLRWVVGQLPGPLKSRAARLAVSPRLFNLTISNVPGPRVPLYAGGVRVRSIHPVIPIGDTHSLALGVLSYGSDLQVAAHFNPEALPEAAELPSLLAAATTELERGVQRAGSPVGGTRRAGGRRHGAAATSPG